MLTGDHFIRFFACLFFGGMLLYSLVGSVWLIQNAFTGTWGWGTAMTFVGFPVCLWLICLYFACLRFLAYLDSRIRLEGWELELRLRAEAERLLEQEHPHAPTPINPEVDGDEDAQPPTVASIGSLSDSGQGAAIR